MSDQTSSAANSDRESILPAEFQLQEEIGSGAHGTVHKALHKTLGQTVAIKFVKTAAGMEEKDMQRFQKEIKAAARLDHAHIVKLLQFGIASDSTPYIVYEYLEGETLQSFLDSPGNTVSPSFLLGAFAQICDAVSYAHSAGIIHRDLKPSNIMILKRSSSSITELKILDFGIARIQPAPESGTAPASESGSTPVKKSGSAGFQPAPAAAELTQTSSSNNPIGSPLYMSPEQCKSASVDARSDIYSIACILYQCLLGKPPFEGDSVFQVLYNHMNEKAPLPDKKLSQPLNSLLGKALAKEPAERQQSIDEFWKELQPALKDWEKFSGQLRNVRSRKIIAVCQFTFLIVAIILFKLLSDLGKVAVKPDSEPAPKAENIYQKRKPIAVENELTEMLHKRQLEDGKPEMNQNSLKLLEKILPRLRDRKQRFIALDVKADTLYNMQKYKEAEELYKEEYKCSLLEDGSLTIESIKSQVMLAQLKVCQKDLKEAAKFASHGYSMLSRMEALEEPARLQLPDYYQCLNTKDMRSVLNYVLALDAEANGKKQDALNYASASTHAISVWRSISLGRPFLLNAKILFEQGKEREARNLIIAIFDEIDDQLPENARGKFDFVNDFSVIDAMNSYNHAAIFLKEQGASQQEICAICKRAMKFVHKHSMEPQNWLKALRPLCPELREDRGP